MLTGASGLLGTWLRQCAPRNLDVVSVVHRRQVAGDVVVADLRDRAAVESAFMTVQPSVVIHAGYARDEASIVDATRHVADMAAEVEADLVFVSSESVFSGDGRVRSETSRPDPVWDYGRWKLAAEGIVQSRDPSAAIVRLPLIVSRTPEDNILTDIRRGLECGEPSVWFTDEMRQPANADELAQAIWAIAGESVASRAGVWHLPGPERLSRFEMATRAVDAIGLSRSSIIAAPTPPAAQRPRDLNLTGSRAQRQIGWRPRRVHEV
jgi:dTDP-4-dehydrorhamnose reductase